MKKYFAKWLPVDGETRPNDRFSSENGEVPGTFHERLHLCSHDIKVGDKLQTPRGEGECISCKLSPRFRTHNLINVKFKECTYHSEGDNCDCTEAYALNEFEVYKIIGEISPSATWVKEEDEFDESEIEECYKDPDTLFMIPKKNSDPNTIDDEEIRKSYEAYLATCSTVYQVKGLCGHLH